ncbi:hypothetical protein A3860_35045 [Niastella vici]|uniref:Uncharacterized protein n=1 Tax=Niastella vici TaxID=1703345 RepID=A0A1V9FNS1_9BACT|nr:hypothetical protein A3860_35045 [Niastella vici]
MGLPLLQLPNLLTPAIRAVYFSKICNFYSVNMIMNYEGSGLWQVLRNTWNREYGVKDHQWGILLLRKVRNAGL